MCQFLQKGWDYHTQFCGKNETKSADFCQRNHISQSIFPLKEQDNLLYGNSSPWNDTMYSNVGHMWTLAPSRNLHLYMEERDRQTDRKRDNRARCYLSVKGPSHGLFIIPSNTKYTHKLYTQEMRHTILGGKKEYFAKCLTLTQAEMI